MNLIDYVMIFNELHDFFHNILKTSKISSLSDYFSTFPKKSSLSKRLAIPESKKAIPEKLYEATVILSSDT